MVVVGVVDNQSYLCRVAQDGLGRESLALRGCQEVEHKAADQREEGSQNSGE